MEKTERYLDDKIFSCFGNTTFFSRIQIRKALIENSNLTDVQRLDLKLELLIAGRQYKDDSVEIDDKFQDRLHKIDATVETLSSMDMDREVASPIDIHLTDEIDLERTLTEGTLSASDFSDSESTGDC